MRDTLKNMKSIMAAVQVECERQHVGEDRMWFLLDAYTRAWELRDSLPTVDRLNWLAGILEPSNGGRLRQTDVVFQGGGYAIPGRLVPENTYRLVEGILPRLVEDGLTVEVVDEFVQQYLTNHARTDGNGREAWLLRVWLLNQWEAPEPLPYYTFY